jgi:hypothetical protein
VGADDFIELALLQQLGHGAQGQAQGRHGGAQAKGVLDGAGGAHLVVTEADPEASGFPVAALAATPFAAPFPTATLTSATPAAEATLLLALGAG